MRESETRVSDTNCNRGDGGNSEHHFRLSPHATTIPFIGV
jgi:hypothetical protein